MRQFLTIFFASTLALVVSQVGLSIAGMWINLHVLFPLWLTFSVLR